ncbi:MAG: hypothetical protein A3I12_06590 [Gammaproteobacteria bacterium RIFCSPLOWO2_02_FULL_38_11]|nr:MAG: hypothetical protein A2W47_03715 [Gammaproteobacteria bacterium RIFCSPHIGHO2_12_38_15]OGT68289.1 MAG: hypothetical protein A3I12_06590 [Gammaproteobacteria bacterium RIFCSPLOWO2_02_FULL_38_11]
MKFRMLRWMLVGVFAVNAWAAGISTPLADNLAFKNDQDKVSYALGVQMGKDFKEQGIVINAGLFSQGLSEGTSGAASKMSTQQIQDTLNNFRKQLIAKKQAEFTAMSDKNKKEGEAFLLKNKSQPGVIVLSDGVQYKILVEGKGQKPKEGESITVDYAGKFVDGKEFDSSYKRGKPAVFTLSKDLIPAWVEVLQMMPVGSVWEVYVPSKMGYGERGVGPIGPNQALIFKIDLKSVGK